MLKQVNILFLLLLMLTVLPMQIHAEEAPSKRGEMQLKTNRLHERDSEERLYETELDRLYPDLFREKTKDKILIKQEEIASSTKELVDLIFEKEVFDTIHIDAGELFDDEYVTAMKVVQGEEMEDSNTSISTTTFATGIGLLISGIIGGSFLFVRFFLTQ